MEKINEIFYLNSVYIKTNLQSGTIYKEAKYSNGIEEYILQFKIYEDFQLPNICDRITMQELIFKYE